MKARSPRRWVKMVSPQFCTAVETDAKRQTVRPLPKGQWPMAGDLISLRAWTGKPYRSKQRVLREGTITKVEGCNVHADGVELGAGTMRVFWMGEKGKRAMCLYSFARHDGFADWPEMKAWFLATHKTLPFEGVVIQWRPDAR
jgi:hypothetical protein